MRRFQTLLCTLCVLIAASAIPAHAGIVSSVDLFTFQLSGIPGSGTALIPGSPTPSSDVPGTSFTLANESATYLGTTYMTDITFFTSGGAGASGTAFSGPPLFSGPVTNPTFLFGNYVLSGIADLGNGPGPVTVYLTIGPDVTAATPEPATLTLLATAGVGLVQLVRRRRC